MNDADRLNEMAIARAARSAFERSVAELDAETRASLARARHEALRRLPAPGGNAPVLGAALGRSPGRRLRRRVGGAELLRERSRRIEALLVGPAGWAAAVAVALAVSLAWLLPGGAPRAPERPVQLASSPDVDLLLEGDELDMLEDLEFYSWLGEQGDAPPADEDGIG